MIEDELQEQLDPPTCDLMVKKTGLKCTRPAYFPTKVWNEDGIERTVNVCYSHRGTSARGGFVRVFKAEHEFEVFQTQVSQRMINKRLFERADEHYQAAKRRYDAVKSVTEKRLVAALPDLVHALEGTHVGTLLRDMNEELERAESAYETTKAVRARIRRRLYKRGDHKELAPKIFGSTLTLISDGDATTTDD